MGEKKGLYEFNLTGYNILTILALAKQGKHLILTGNNKL